MWILIGVLALLALLLDSVSSYRLAGQGRRRITSVQRCVDSDGGLEAMGGGDKSGVSKITSSGVSTVEKFLMMYTCKLCGGRNAHMVSKVAYNHGMVVTTCRHCKNRHLISDNEQKLDMGPETPAYQKIEELLKARGEKVQKMQVGSKQDLIEGRYLVEQDGDSINVVDLQAAVETLERYERGEPRADEEAEKTLEKGEGNGEEDDRRMRFITRPIDPGTPEDNDAGGRAPSNE